MIEEETKDHPKIKKVKNEEVQNDEGNKDKEKVKKIRNFDHFYFAVAKQSISIVNKVSGEEYKII